MKILILGDPNKFFRIEYVKNMKIHYPNYEFHIASNVKLATDNTFYDKVIHFQYKKRNLIYEYKSMKKQIEELEDYDYIHIHSANMFWIPFMYFLKKKAKKVILTYYGSDFYRVKKNRKPLFLFFNGLVDVITFISERMQNEVSKYILNDTKSVVIPFGNSVMRDIDKVLEQGKENIKKEMSISSEDIVISVGYNSTRQQRHLEILEILEKLLKRYPNTTVILPLNYGDDEYKQQLHSELERFDLKIKTYDEFLTGKDIAKLRSVSDIMIHLQDSDQFSASIVEYLYAENILVNGSWIDYRELKEWGIYYKEINFFEELPTEVEAILKKIDIEKGKISSRNILKEHLGWDKVSKKWNQLYQ